MATYYKGHNGKVVISSTTMSVKSWEATHEAALLDVTSTTSAGKEQVEPGLEKLTFTMEAQWSAANNPYGTVSIPPGTQLTSVVLSVAASDSIFNITDGYVGKATVTDVVDGVVTWKLEGQANAWTVVGSSAS